MGLFLEAERSREDLLWHQEGIRGEFQEQDHKGTECVLEFEGACREERDTSFSGRRFEGHRHSSECYSGLGSKDLPASMQST